MSLVAASPGGALGDKGPEQNDGEMVKDIGHAGEPCARAREKKTL